MAGLRELKKRLKSIRTTGQLAGAMRTVAAAKYARLSAQTASYSVYAAALRDMLALAGGIPAFLPAPAPDAPDCLVALGGNRGLCGGFNAELTGFFGRQYAAMKPSPLLITGGKTIAAYCREKGLAVAHSVPLSDAPLLSEVRALSDDLWARYTAGTVRSVTVVSQHFTNMLVQTPAVQRLLPPPEPEAQTSGAETLLLPDAETVYARLSEHAFHAAVYALALDSAAGAQAATLMAMRSAYDNAESSAAELETAINRRRQAEVTAGVIETASDNF